MSSTGKSGISKWIDLHDSQGVMLKAALYGGTTLLVITGLSPRRSEFRKAIEQLKFRASQTGAFLLRPVLPNEQIHPNMFRSIWPNAGTREMPRSEYILKIPEKKVQTDATAQEETSREEIDLAQILQQSEWLGLNSEGQRVFENTGGRFFLKGDGDNSHMVLQAPNLPRSLFLQVNTIDDLAACAQGYIFAAQQGVTLRQVDFDRFVRAVHDGDSEIDEPTKQSIIGSIDQCVLNAIAGGQDTLIAPTDAWAESVALFEAVSPSLVLARETPSIPIPVLIAAHRLIASDTDDVKTIWSPGLVKAGIADGARRFSPSAATIWTDSAGQELVSSENGLDGLTIGTPGQPLDAALVIDIDASTQDMVDSQLDHVLDKVKRNGRAVLVFETDRTNPDALFEKINSQGNQVEHAFQIGSPLVKNAGIQGNLLVISAIKGKGPSKEKTPFPTCYSWDEVKALTDEILATRPNAADKDADAVIDPFKDERQNRFQRAYVAFSKTGQASTMVPKDLQASINFALSRVESEFGDIDSYVARELGIGLATLPAHYSPEQIDAIALMTTRINRGRGMILGDETGIGKGRTIAALATWANKLGRPVIFVTDRANLFSDLARDLIDIDEWDRFSPFPMNSDGTIIDIMGGGEILVNPIPIAQMNKCILEDIRPADLGKNIIFTTYSQINGKDSAKGAWLLEQCPDALLIVDEAHIAAGGDSNIANQIRQMAESSWGVIYSSATWAKNAKNLHIYSRALPESVSISQISTAMKRGGDDFAEVFSSMLARDGGFIRREHDLSKIDFEVHIDSSRIERNSEVMGAVSNVLGMMAVLSGEIERLLHRSNGETRNLLAAAREARKQFLTSAKTRKAALEAIIEEVDREIERLPDGSDPAPQLATKAEAQKELKALSKEMKGSGSSASGQIFSSSFGTGGALYQVLRRTIASLSVDHAVERALNAIDGNRRPVIVFEDTGEAFVKRLIDEELERLQSTAQKIDAAGADQSMANELTTAVAKHLDKSVKKDEIVTTVRVPTLRDLLLNNLAKLGGVKIRTENSTDSEGGIDHRGEQGNPDDDMKSEVTIADIPGVSEEDVEKYRAGLQKIADAIDQVADLPINAADIIRNRLSGTNLSLKVGEISGRHYELELINEEETDPNQRQVQKGKLKKRARKKTDVMRTVREFNSGHLDSLLINRSGATGVSLHSSPRFGDTRQRELIEFQIPENPTDRIQLYGRVNRFDQVIPPRISILTSGLPGEIRNLMMQNKKLSDLSANIRSSRDNAAMISNVHDMLNAMGDEVCEEFLLENSGIASRMAILPSRLANRQGLANLVTQRIGLLAPADQKSVYDTLYANFEDAIMRKELSGQSGFGGKEKDWGARTIDEQRAWGPTEHLDLLSAFDGPVHLRTVQFTKEFKPLRWTNLVSTIAETNDALVAAGYAKKLPPNGTEFNGRLSLADLRAERELERPEVRAKQVNSLRTQILSSAQQEAQIELDKETAFGPPHPEVHALCTAVINSEPNSIGAMLNAQKFLSGKWLQLGIRRSGDHIVDRFVGLVSKTDPSIDLWQHNGDKSGQLKLLLDTDNPMEALQVIGRIENPNSTDEWVDVFNHVYGPSNPSLGPVSLKPSAGVALGILEGKKLIALAQTNFIEIDDALAHPEHNPVKEAHWRARFVDVVLPKLTPGSLIKFTDEHASAYVNFFNNREMLISKVEIPPKGEEATLSRWKFHVSSPGDENTTILTAATIYKRSGLAPEFPLISVSKPLFFNEREDDREAAAELYRHHEAYAGPRTHKKKLLVGNIFQALEWASETKAGWPIMYTDETGQRLRAIEIHRADLADMDLLTLPLRMHHKEMISEFISEIICPTDDNRDASRSASDHNTMFVGTSFKSGLKVDKELGDNLIFEPHVGIVVLVDKEEKNRLTKMLKDAFKRDEASWNVENQNNLDEAGALPAYPIRFSVKATKSSSSISPLVLPMPVSDKEAVKRFMNVYIKAVGLQLYVPRRHHYLYTQAVAAEREFYRTLADRLEPARVAREEQQIARHSRADHVLGISSTTDEASNDGQSEIQDTNLDHVQAIDTSTNVESESNDLRIRPAA